MRNFDDRVENSGATAQGRLSAAEDNTRFKEMENLVSTSGITLDPQSGPDTDFNMLAQAAARYASGGIFGIGSGTGNSQVVSASSTFVAPKALFDGMEVFWYPSNPNTGATTLNAFSLGAKSVKTVDGAALIGGELRGPCVVKYSLATDSYLLMPWSGGTINKRSYVEAIDSSGTFAAANNTYTTLTGFGTTNLFLRDAASSFSAGVLTVRGVDAGLWLISARVRTAATVSWGLALRLYRNNSIDLCSNGEEAAGAASRILHGSVTWPCLLADTDTVRAQVIQTSGSSQTFSIYRVTATRLGDA